MNMNIKITQKQLSIAHTALFLLSFLFLKYSEIFRISQEKHWIYSFGHLWWFMVGIPALLGSFILSIYNLWQSKKHKIPYFIFSLIALFIFITFIFV